MSTKLPLVATDFVVPQSYGRDCRRLFFTNPDVTNLNHGSFGTIPEPVQRACEALTRECEGNPDAFIRMQLFNRHSAARKAVSELIGVDDPDTCVFINNVSTAMNTILHNFRWSAKDHIICTDAIFPSITLAVESISPAPKISTFSIGHYKSHESAVHGFQNHINDVKMAMGLQSGEAPSKTFNESPKIVAILESITASPSLLLPWRDMVRICRKEEIWSIVDAAHSLGQETDINLVTVDPDFWMTNCAKWCYAMRGCAVLYVPLRNQNIVPLVPGVCYPTRGPTPSKFVQSFYWSGLTDPVASLSIEFAIAFRQRMGGDVKINAYCHSLAVAGGRLVAKILGTTVMDTSESGELTANMTNIELPIASTIKQSPDIYFLFEDEMLEGHKIFASPFYYEGQWWVRASAQIYNDLSDFERLAIVLVEICRKINLTRISN